MKRMGTGPRTDNLKKQSRSPQEMPIKTEKSTSAIYLEPLSVNALGFVHLLRSDMNMLGDLWLW